MKIEGAEVERLTRLLATNVKFKLDKNKYINKQRKLILVEGITDQEFIKHIQNDCVDCIVASNVFNSNNKFRSNPENTVNCKNAIVTIIKAVSHYPSPFLKYPDEIDKWELYGLVDSDFEDNASSKPTPRLFVTDTHDLETLLLSTDSNLLSKIDECTIQENEISNAFFVAYQLALIRAEVENYKKEFDLKSIKAGSEIDFSFFVKAVSISVPNLIKYISQNTPGGVSKSKIQSVINSVCSSKSLKKKVDIAGNWNQSIQEFFANLPDDFWMVVNGHDILQLLTYFSEGAARRFAESRGYSLNRSFELNLIKAYDYKHFKKTSLFEKMNGYGLLRLL